MNRKAKYATDYAFRIISVPNGFWRLQKLETDGSWWNIGPSTDYEQATAALRAREPAKARAA